MSLVVLRGRLQAMKERYPWIAPKRYAGTKVIHFWNQLAIALIVYFGYEATSSIAGGSNKEAVSNALKEVRLERALHIFNEHGIQSFFVDHFVWLVRLSNLFYVTVHFVLPVVVLVILFRKFPERYLVWRNVMAVLNIIALVIFAMFPVAPPHMLPASYHFIDTQSVIGGAGSLDAMLMKDAGNPYAAMPSLHFAWAIWCAWALAPVVKNKWARRALIADPFVTTFVVIVTANHFWIDIAGGMLVFLISCTMFKAFSQKNIEDKVVLGSSRH